MMIRNNKGITDLDISNCRLGSHICKDLASAIASDRAIRFLLLDGNPFGDGAGVPNFNVLACVSVYARARVHACMCMRVHVFACACVLM
jgi:hypothetical protein